MRPRAQRVVDYGGEQGDSHVFPAGVGEPRTLIHARPSCDLERKRSSDDEVTRHELVNDHLIDLDTAGATGDEAIEGG